LQKGVNCLKINVLNISLGLGVKDVPCLGMAHKRGSMKFPFYKSLVAAGALSAGVAFVACSSDDSGTSSGNPSQPVVANVCTGVVATENVSVIDLGDKKLVVYPVTIEGPGKVTLADGTPFGTFDGAAIYDEAGAKLLDTDIDMLSNKCAATATVDPTTGEVVVNSSASAEVPGVGSSASVPGTTPSAESSAAAEPVKTAGNPEEDIKLYAVPTLKNILGNGTTGWNTRYWDACKAHCSQTSTDGKEGLPKINTQEEYAASHYTARVCNINDIEIPTFTYSKGLERYWVGIQNTPNACAEASPASGGGFTCTDMAPVAVNDTLAYAFVAGSAETTSCGKCFHLQYDGSFKDADGNNAPKETHKSLKGKHIIVMASNIGHDVKPGQFDLMVPGGGPGIFNALELQINKTGIEWGEQYGGFLSYCQKRPDIGYDGSLTQLQTCVKEMCDAAFGDSKYSNLLRGCHWFADWYMAADNPTYQWEEVECPQYLLDKYTTTISTSIETKILYQSDWSKYKGGDFITTDACSKTPNATGEYCDPDQLAADKAKTY